MKNKAFVMSQRDNATVASCRLGDNVALMCPKCYSIYKINQSGFISARSSISIDLLISPTYHIQCVKCGSNSTAIVLEVPISFAVSRLNRLGYKTEMSCCGHDGSYSNHSFIKFVDEYKFECLPDGWYLEGLFLRSVSFDNSQSIECLNEWVRTLKNRYTSINY